MAIHPWIDDDPKPQSRSRDKLHGHVNLAACQLLLVLRQQRFNLLARFVADRVDLRTEILA